MIKPVKELPPGYLPVGGVSIKKPADILQMLVWSIVLPALCILAMIPLMRWGSSSPGLISFGGDDLLKFLGGLLLVTVVMLVLHEGLHGLVFWLTTREAPKFAFKWYYASASPGEWYLPRRQFMIATLLPLVAITLIGLFLIPFAGSAWRFLLILLIIFNASGAAGDMLVALRLTKLPPQTLSRDTGAEVTFFAPPSAK